MLNHLFGRFFVQLMFLTRRVEHGFHGFGVKYLVGYSHHHQHGSYGLLDDNFTPFDLAFNENDSCILDGGIKAINKLLLEDVGNLVAILQVLFSIQDANMVMKYKLLSFDIKDGNP